MWSWLSASPIIVELDTNHGSNANTLETTNTPYVDTSETIIRAKMGDPKFFTAWMLQRTAQTNMLKARGECPVCRGKGEHILGCE